jgi:hypothetical protein
MKMAGDMMDIKTAGDTASPSFYAAAIDVV